MLSLEEPEPEPEPEPDMKEIDSTDQSNFMERMFPVVTLFYPRNPHNVPSRRQEHWEKYYRPYVHMCSGQVVPRPGCKWRFLRFDLYAKFKKVSIETIKNIVSTFVSVNMIGLFPLTLHEAIDQEMMSHLFYRFYAQFIDIVDGEASINSSYRDHFLLRCNAEEKVTREISKKFEKYDDMAIMERPCTPDESPTDNETQGGIYQRLSPTSARSVLREGRRLVSKVLLDYPFLSKQVVFADLGSGMNHFPLYASSMFAWTSIGIEVVVNRVQLAAFAQSQLFQYHPWFKRLRVGLFCKNLLTENDNWSGILCFLMWDKVYNVDLVENIFRIIAASMTHDVVLIMSTKSKGFKEKREAMDDLFTVVEEGDELLVSMSHNGGSDRMKGYRLKLKPKVAGTDITPLVDRYAQRFNTPNRKRAMIGLEQTMRARMEQQRERKTKK